MTRVVLGTASHSVSQSGLALGTETGLRVGRSFGTTVGVRGVVANRISAVVVFIQFLNIHFEIIIIESK